MKPFDLERAKAGDPVVDESGDEYRFILHEPDALASHRVILFNTTTKTFSKCFEDGKTLNKYHPRLFMKPVKKTVYVNFYSDGSAAYHETEKRALECANHHAFASAVLVEIEL
ncbi:hypothetical protein [Orrella sp. 11846]|uniref:hypothetical protein n=1 Tax=Orrella sp. 11846 TaxID=3409913 RepID=UPI003B59CC18